MTEVLQLKVPKIQLTELSFTQTSAAAFDQWLSDLPKANLGELSRQLYHCFLEFNQLDISPEERLQRLEQLRPLTYFTLQGLSKHFLNSSLDLTPHQRKAANLAQSLQNHLAVGYKHVILGLCNKGASSQITQALHRAISELSLTYLRACHLYCPTPSNIWLELHQLFSFAQQHELLDEQVADNENAPGAQLSILDTYRRVLLFSLCNSNHLRQKEQQHVFAACTLWCKEILLSPNPDEGLFAINLTQDQGPSYSALLKQTDNQLTWFIDTQPLREQLTQYLSTTETEQTIQAEQLPIGIDQSILRHLSKTWGPMLPRAHKRVPGDGHLQLAIGFSATHFFIAGEEEFNLWLADQGSNQHERNQASQQSDDVWSHAADVADDDLHINQHLNEALNFDQTIPDSSALAANYPLFEAQLIDASPGGYSILWEGTPPPQLQAGEVLGIKNDKQHWNLAVVRWIRLQSSKKILVGLQLLPPNPRPGAIAVVHTSGGYSQYMRCFLIEEPQGSDGQGTLLTPRISFQVGHKVRLVDNGQVHTSRLTECSEQTSSFAQFNFNTPSLETKKEPSKRSDTKNDQDFDKLWHKL